VLGMIMLAGGHCGIPLDQGRQIGLRGLLRDHEGVGLPDPRCPCTRGLP
jgi:hypothetical protein